MISIDSCASRAFSGSDVREVLVHRVPEASRGHEHPHVHHAFVEHLQDVILRTYNGTRTGVNGLPIATSSRAPTGRGELR
jgi:hypothetical protein